MNDKVILVVDDEIDLLEMIQSIFERAGFFNILTASSGTEALKIWKERQPDMIILDIMMPGIDGLSVLREVRETSNIPVLLLTARGEAEDRVSGKTVSPKRTVTTSTGNSEPDISTERTKNIFRGCCG